MGYKQIYAYLLKICLLWIKVGPGSGFLSSAKYADLLFLGCSPLEAITSYLNLNLCCKDYRYEIVEAVGPEVAAGQVTAPEAGEHLVHPGVQQVAGARLHKCRYQLKGRMRFLRLNPD